jgi:glycosyltransferase involved in cell wall biosynthesis
VVSLVLLIANYRLDGQQSMTRAAELLENGLRSRGKEVDVVRPEPFLGQLAKGIPGLAKWLAYIDKYLLFPFSLIQRARNCALVHIVDHSNAIYLFWLRSRKVVVTCNDLLAVRSGLGEMPEHRTGFTGRLLQKWVLAGLRRADHIVCISEATRADVLRLTSKPEKEVSTIYLGLAATFDVELQKRLNQKAARATKGASAERCSGLGIELSEPFTTIANGSPRVIPGPYLLHVGGNTWYKNRQGVLDIYCEVRRRLGKLAPNLIMVGPALETEIEGVHFCQEVTDGTLAELYRNAALLLFPSLYEGFGWPVVEANACGCPAVVSRIAPHIEAGGSAATFISDPRDINEAADCVIEILRSDTFTTRNRQEAGYVNACRFSLQHMITEYIEMYDSVARE